MENSGKAIDQSPLPVGQMRGLSPLRRHRTATAEHLPKATRACEMAGLIGIWAWFRKSPARDFPAEKLEKPELSGSLGAYQTTGEWPRPRPGPKPPPRRPGR